MSKHPSTWCTSTPRPQEEKHYRPTPAAALAFYRKLAIGMAAKSKAQHLEAISKLEEEIAMLSAVTIDDVVMEETPEDFIDYGD